MSAQRRLHSPLRLPVDRYYPAPEPRVTECPGCGTQWSDGRAYCDDDHCERDEAARHLHD